MVRYHASTLGVMTDLRRQSPAQKRRAGVPLSAYHEPQAGRAGAMGVTPGIEDPMQVGLAGMAGNATGNARTPIGMDVIRNFVNTSAQSTSHGISHPRFSQPASDPAFFPTARPQPQLQEKAGARYGLRVNMPIPVSIEASATQRNGRTIKGRGTGGSFWGGAAV